MDVYKSFLRAQELAETLVCQHSYQTVQASDVFQDHCKKKVDRNFRELADLMGYDVTKREVK